MATATQQSGRKNFVDFDEFIEFQLKKTRSNIKLTDILTAIAGVGAMVIAYLLVFVVFDHWVVDGGFGNTTRWLMLGGLLTAATGWVVWKVVLPARKNVTGLFAARTIEQTEPGLKSGLVNLVDLQQAGRKVPDHIRAAMEKQTAVALSKTNIDEAVDRRPLMRLSYVLLALVVMFCLYTLISPKTISGSIWRALMPSSDTAVDTTIKIDKVSVVLRNPKTQQRANAPSSLGERLLPADVTIPARSKIDVVVDLLFSDEPPEEVKLYFTTQDGKFLDVPVTMKADADEVKRYRVRLTGEYGRGILQNTSYRIEAGDAKAGPFQITVTHPPIATVSSLTYNYLPYMERESKVQQGGHIDTWVGTKVSLRAVSDRPVHEAWIVFHDSEDISKVAGKKMMTIAGGTQLSVDLQDELYFRPDGGYSHFYHVLCRDKTGLTDPRPVLYGVRLHPDLPPKVEIVDPTRNELELPSNTEKLPVMYTAKDPDFKLQFITRRSEMTRAGNEGQKPEMFDRVVSKKKAKAIRDRFEWDLQELRAKPGDSLRFRLEAQDNKHPRYNVGYSRWITVRFIAPVDQKQLQKDLDKKRQEQDRKEKEDQGDKGGDPPPNGQQDKNQDGGKGAGDQPKEAKNTQKGDKTGRKPSKDKTGGGMGEKQDTDNPQPGENPQKQGGDGAGTQPREQQPDGGLGDDEVRKFDQERMQDQQRNEKPKDGQKQPNQKGNQPGGDPKPNDQATDNNTPQADGKNGMGNRPDQKQTAGTPPKNGTKPKSGDPTSADPKPNGTGKQKTPKSNTGGMDDKTDTGDPKPDRKKTNDGMKEQKTGRDPKTDGKSAGGKGKSDKGKQSGKGKSDKGKAGKTTGTPTDPKGATPDSKTPGKGTQPKDSKSNSKAQPSEGPVDGNKSKTAPGKKPTRKQPGTGDETGDADANPDRDAKATRTNKPNQLQTDPNKPKTTRKSNDKPQGKTQRKGSPNAGKVKDKSGDKKTETNPDTRPTKPKKSGGKPPQRKTDGKNTPGNEKLKGKTPPQGRQTKKTEGGDQGKNRQSDQGTKGGMKQGAGDDSKKPGKMADANGMKTGKSGSKTGSGSKTRESGTKAGKSSQAPMSGNAQSGGGKTTPNQAGGDPKNAGKKERNPNGQPGAGTGPINKGRNENPPPPADASPKTKADYGDKAVGFTLKYLEDKLKRGEADENWLKKHGFSSKDQLRNAIDRTKQRRQNAKLTKEQQKQRDLFHQSFYDARFKKKSGVHLGKNTGKRDLGVSSSDNSEPPPQLKDYYKSFTESTGGGRSKNPNKR